MGSFLANLVSLIINVFELILLARIIASWLQVNPYNPIMQFLYRITEPVLAPIRRMLPPTGMMDFSPLVVFVILLVLQAILIQVIFAIFPY